MADRPLSRAELLEVAESVRRVLQSVQAGELTASAAMTQRLEGAKTALEAVLAGLGAA